MKKYLKHSENPERDEKSKLANTVSDSSIGLNQPPINETLKYGLGTMHYERMNRKEKQDSYTTR